MTIKKINNDERNKEIVDAQLRGLSWDEIAVAYDFASGQQAYGTWRKIVSKEYSTTAEAVEEYRRLELSHIDHQLYILELAQQENPENLKIIDKVMGLLERRAKLLGLDAPSKADINMNVNHEAALEALDLLNKK